MRTERKLRKTKETFEAYHHRGLAHSRVGDAHAALGWRESAMEQYRLAHECYNAALYYLRLHHALEAEANLARTKGGGVLFAMLG